VTLDPDSSGADFAPSAAGVWGQPDRWPFAVTLDGDAQVRAALQSWAATADDLDRLDLALAIYDFVEPSDASAQARARLLLLSGRPAEGLEVLTGLSSSVVEGGGAPTSNDLLTAACRSAMGDANAYQWLLARTSELVASGQGWGPTYLVAGAATGRGDIAIADQAWTALVRRYGVRTGLTVAKAIAADIAVRDQTDPGAVVLTLAESAKAAESLIHRVELDPQPVLDAASDLERRGDDAGARLLLHLVRRRNPPIPRARMALEAVTPRRDMQIYRIKVWSVLAVAVCLAPLGILGLPLIFVGGVAFRRYVRVPGLGPTDSDAWRGLNRVGYDPRTRAPRHGGGSITGLDWLVLTIGAVLGVIGAALTTALLVSVTGVPDPASLNPLVLIGVWLTGIAAVPILAILACRGIITRVEVARQRRVDDGLLRRRLALASRCDCWQTRALTDAMARAYLARHLRQAPADPTLKRLHEQLAGTTTFAACPETGALWLAVGESPEGAVLLLRGPVSAPATQEESDSQAGFYL